MVRSHLEHEGPQVTGLELFIVLLLRCDGYILSETRFVHRPLVIIGKRCGFSGVKVGE